MHTRGPHPALAAVLLVLAASSLLAACGDEGTNPELLPEKLANSMLDDLEEAQAALEDGDCGKMRRRLDKVFDAIAALGSPPTDRELKDNLREGINTVQEDANAECSEAQEPEDEPAEPVPAPDPAPAPPEEPEDSEDEEDPTAPDETNPDQPDEQPPPEEEPPAPEPDDDPPEPAPTPPADPEPPSTPGGSGGVGPGSVAGGG